MYNGNYTKLI